MNSSRRTGRAVKARTGRHNRILVIKLGAFGDFVYALGPMAAIRRHHKDARVTLLTTAPYEDFARASDYFDDVWVDSRPKLWNVAAGLRLRARLRGGRFDRIYDLQTSDRSGFYFRLLGPGPRPEWSGIVPGCSHPDTNPDRRGTPTIERQRRQLKDAGIDRVPLPDLSWVKADISRFGLDAPFVLLAPGSSPVQPLKRWPIEAYGKLAARLAACGIIPVVLGGPAEAGLAAAISNACPAARDMTGQTSLLEIAALGRAAAAAVGNDTGPWHMVAAARCPSVLLLSKHTVATLRDPQWQPVTVLFRPAVADLSVDDVANALAQVSKGRVAP